MEGYTPGLNYTTNHRTSIGSPSLPKEVALHTPLNRVAKSGKGQAFRNVYNIKYFLDQNITEVIELQILNSRSAAAHLRKLLNKYIYIYCLKTRKGYSFLFLDFALKGLHRCVIG